MYQYFLEVLPPIVDRGEAFIMGEMATGTLVDAFIQIGERCFYLVVEYPGQQSFMKTVQEFRRYINESERTVS